MTLCIGWIYEGRAFLVGDTAATSSIFSNGQSSFGETEQVSDGKYVRERIPKIVALKENCAVAYSGNIALAVEMIRFLKAEVQSSEDLHSLLTSLSNSSGPFSEHAFVELIIAIRYRDRAGLVYWNTKGEVRETVDHLIIGSLDSALVESLTTGFVEHFRRSKHHPNQFLPCMSAFLQSAAMHEALVRQGIGGAFFGLELSVAGVRWQPDTAYLLYPAKLRGSSVALTMVTVMAREGVVVVRTWNQAPKAMAVDVDVAQWHARWISNLAEVEETFAYTCWCFLVIEHWKVVLAFVTPNAVKRPFTVSRNESRTVLIEFESQFLDFLTAPPADISTLRGLGGDNPSPGVRLDVIHVQSPGV